MNDGFVDWQLVALEDVAEIHDAGRVPIKASERVSGSIPYCGANGVIDYVDGFTHDGRFVLLAEDGGFFGPGERSSYIMDGKFWANNHVHILRVKPDVIVSEYLHYYLNHVDLRSFAPGATRPKLTQSVMRRIPISLPYPDNPARSLDTQRRIVARIEALLSEVRDMRALQGQIGRDTNRLLYEIVRDAFQGGITEGWEWKTVSSLVKGNPQYGTSQKSNTDGIGLPVLRMGNIQDGELTFDDIKYVDVSPEDHARYVLNFGDILFNRTNSAELVGKTAVFRATQPMVFASYLVRLAPDLDKADPEYIALYINSSFGRKYIESQYVRAIGQVNVNAQKLIAMPIPVPPTVNEQTRFVQRIRNAKTEITEMKAINASDSVAIDNLEAAILARAFRGEL